jgi:hypothetical protein
VLRNKTGDGARLGSIYYCTTITTTVTITIITIHHSKPTSSSNPSLQSSNPPNISPIPRSFTQRRIVMILRPRDTMPPPRSPPRRPSASGSRCSAPMWNRDVLQLPAPRSTRRLPRAVAPQFTQFTQFTQFNQPRHPEMGNCCQMEISSQGSPLQTAMRRRLRGGMDLMREREGRKESSPSLTRVRCFALACLSRVRNVRTFRSP